MNRPATCPCCSGRGTEETLTAHRPGRPSVLRTVIRCLRFGKNPCAPTVVRERPWAPPDPTAPPLAAVVTGARPGESYRRACADRIRARAPLVVLTVGGRAARLAVDLRPRGEGWTPEERGAAALVLLPYQRRERHRLRSAPCWTAHGLTVEGLPSPCARVVAEALVQVLGGPWPAALREARS